MHLVFLILNRWIMIYPVRYPTFEQPRPDITQDGMTVDHWVTRISAPRGKNKYGKKCFNLKKQLIINKLVELLKFLKVLKIENRKILPARNGFARIVKKE